MSLVSMAGPGSRLQVSASSDTTPNAFTFADQTGIALSSTITSAAITVSGIDAASAITVSGGTYDINASGTFVSTAGTVNNGDTVRARVSSSASYSTAASAIVTIGGVSDTFTATTLADPGAGVTYVPWYTNAMDTGTVGANPSYMDVSYTNTKVNSDITGPFGEAKVLKVSLSPGGTQQYGGVLNSSGTTLPLNGHSWVRLYCYFPSVGFKAGCQTGEGGPTIGLKFWRFEYATGQRNTFKLSGFTLGSATAAGSSPTVMGMAPELSTTDNNYLSSPPIIPRDQWVALQAHLIHGSTTGTSLAEFWMNDTYLGQATILAPQYGNTATVDMLVIGDYWNGDALAGGTFHYISNIIATKDEPNTLDGGGRPYIAPTTQVTDF